jgi:trimethylamine corrinoid protein
VRLPGAQSKKTSPIAAYVVSPNPFSREKTMSQPNKSLKEQLVDAIADMEEDQAYRLAETMLAEGQAPQSVLDGAREAMTIIGARFEKGEYFLPELIIAGEVLRKIGDLVKPRMAAEGARGTPRGKVLIGTVAGDIHDLGKDIVIFMLDVNNFQVVDLGVDVPAAKFVEAIKEAQPQVVGMSGFLTLAFEQMKRTVEAITAAGLRDQVKIMIGGAIMDNKAAQMVGADAYGADAAAAVSLTKSWIGGK